MTFAAFLGILISNTAQNVPSLKLRARCDRSGLYSDLSESPRNDTFFDEIRDLEKSRQIWKGFIDFQGTRRCFFCDEEKPEKPRKMYSTKLFTFSEVSLAFPKHRKNTFEGPENL